MTMPDFRKPPAIAIIGGGFSGSMVAAHLLRLATHPLTVHLIEARPQSGLGMAYSTAEEHHLLNVPADRMSAWPHDPGHFLRWLRNQDGQAVEAGRFAARKRYGFYVQQILQATEQQVPQFARLERIHQEAVAVVLDVGGAVVCWKGGALPADYVVLAAGNFPPADPAVADRVFYQSRRYITDPWSAAAFSSFDPADAILLIGSGLTMIDLALTLQARGHQGIIHAISRHGLLPQGHAPCADYPAFLTAGDLSITVRGLLCRVRQEIRKAAAYGYDWRAVIDALRSQTPALWQALSMVERKRFLRHLRPYWDTHRHRTAPAITDIIARLLESQQLQVHAGRIQAFNERTDGVDVIYRPRHHQELRALRVNRVINCTGPQSDYQRLSQPLMVNLLATGLIQPHPLGLGLEVDSDGALLNAAGSASTWLYTLGPPRQGDLWETTAVPEIRVQAEALARHLLRQVAARDSVAPVLIEDVI